MLRGNDKQPLCTLQLRKIHVYIVNDTALLPVIPAANQIAINLASHSSSVFQLHKRQQVNS